MKIDFELSKIYLANCVRHRCSANTNLGDFTERTKIQI